MKNIIIINRLFPTTANSIEELINTSELPRNLEVIVLRDKNLKDDKKSNAPIGLPIKTISCDYENEIGLKKIIQLYVNNNLAVICRMDRGIYSLAKLAPLMPDAFLPTQDALLASTNKSLMREKFINFDPSITPRFRTVNSLDSTLLNEIASDIDFPLIVKPVAEASSKFIKACTSRSEYNSAMHDIFTVLDNKYQDDKTKASIVVEKLLEGELYSGDGYVDNENIITICPVRLFNTHEDVGINDFSVYKRVMPPESIPEQKELKDVVKKGVRALGLTNTTFMFDMIHTSEGWKIIEIGARISRFRIPMYEYVNGFSHSNNDILIRMGKKPIVSFDSSGYFVAYSIYPLKEGKIKKINGVKEVKNLASHYKTIISAKVGDESKFAKNGGSPVVEVLAAHRDKTVFEKDCAFIEEALSVEVE